MIVSRLLKLLRVKKQVSPLVASCREATKGLNLEIHWVKGHANVTGNEFVDYLAKNGAQNKEATVRKVPLAMSTFKRNIKDAVYKAWNKSWKNEPTCRITKRFVGNPCRDLTKYLLGKAKYHIKLITDFITGHTALLKSHGFKLGHSESQLCRKCDLKVKESSDHLFFECPAFERWRVENYYLSSNGNIGELVHKFLSKSSIKELYTFHDGAPGGSDDKDGNLGSRPSSQTTQH